MDFEEASELYQTATMGSLIRGVYDGNTTIHDLAQHGDFGLGTFNALDGEMVMFEGRCYQLRGNGTATVAADRQLLPFAAVTWFRPHDKIHITARSDRSAMCQLIDQVVDSTNLMVAVRIRGDFNVITTRAVTRQNPPYPRFVDATREQQQMTLHGVHGDLIGFRMPSWTQGISVAGYHLHFIDGSRQRGGHALDYVLREATVEFSVCSDLHLRLPQTPQFETADLSGDADAEIRRTEGTR